MVRREDGKVMNAEAFKDEYEYFAELSETYFWRNNFYPFTQKQLFEYDPLGAQMVQTSWGITIDYKIAVTTWLGTVWLIVSLFVRMGDNSTSTPIE